MDSVQLKTKELQNKMYLTETHRLIGFIKEAIGTSVEVPGPHFELKKVNFCN